MRPGQQNKRGRGRGNNNNGGGGGNNNNNNGFNRKGGNPLTRTYDSSGPDVKIRGTAQHIAEKYAALARDAQSSGDRVMAENYLQHAEHYNRIIASAQAQMQERFQRDERSDYNERDADDIDGVENEDGAAVAVAPQQPQPQPQPQQPRQPSQPRQQSQPRPAPAPVAAPAPEPVVIDGTGPQPVIEGTPVEVAAEEAEQAAEAPARAPARRRATGARPRRPRRTAAGAEGGDGEASGGEEPAEQPTLAEAPGE